MLILHEKIKELIEYLIYVFKYSNSINIIIKIKNKYIINLIIIKENITIKIENLDYKYNLKNIDSVLCIEEELLVKMYNTGITISELIKQIKNGTIKSEKIKIYKLYNFLKNFNLSPEKWEEFYKKYNKIEK